GQRVGRGRAVVDHDPGRDASLCRGHGQERNSQGQNSEACVAGLSTPHPHENVIDVESDLQTRRCPRRPLAFLATTNRARSAWIRFPPTAHRPSSPVRSVSSSLVVPLTPLWRKTLTVRPARQCLVRDSRWPAKSARLVLLVPLCGLE